MFVSGVKSEHRDLTHGFSVLRQLTPTTERELVEKLLLHICGQLCVTMGKGQQTGKTMVLFMCYTMYRKTSERIKKSDETLYFMIIGTRKQYTVAFCH